MPSTIEWRYLFSHILGNTEIPIHAILSNSKAFPKISTDINSSCLTTPFFSKEPLLSNLPDDWFYCNIPPLALASALASQVRQAWLDGAQYSVKESTIYRSKLGKPEGYHVWGLRQKEWYPPQTLPYIDDKIDFRVSQYKMRILWTEYTDRVVVRKWERVWGGSWTHGGLLHFIQQCQISGTNLDMTWALVLPGNRDRRGWNSKVRQRENLRKLVTRHHLDCSDMNADTKSERSAQTSFKTEIWVLLTWKTTAAAARWKEVRETSWAIELHPNEDTEFLFDYFYFSL